MMDAVLPDAEIVLEMIDHCLEALKTPDPVDPEKLRWALAAARGQIARDRRAAGKADATRQALADLAGEFAGRLGSIEQEANP